MKTTGWISTVLGTLLFFGCLIGGRSPIGPLFWIGLGIYLIHRAEQKKKEKEEQNKWNNENN